MTGIERRINGPEIQTNRLNGLVSLARPARPKE